jgi:hypothetical protein
MLPNPAIFSINEVVFAVTSVDTLMPIRATEYVRDAKRIAEAEEMDMDEAPKDAISRVCRHVLRQRIFYPTFPAPLPGPGQDTVNLDVTHMELLKLGEVGADIAIMPSALGKHFVKVRCFFRSHDRPVLKSDGQPGRGQHRRRKPLPVDERLCRRYLHSLQHPPNGEEGPAKRCAQRSSGS